MGVLFSDKTPKSISKEKITVQFKSISNYRTRKGSEDIALNPSSGYYQGGKTPWNFVQPCFNNHNNEKVYNSFKMAPSYEKKLDSQNLRGVNMLSEFNSGSFKFDSPVRKLNLESNTGMIPPAINLHPVKEENQESFPDRPSDQDRESFGNEYLNSFKSKSYKMVAKPHKRSSEYNCHEKWHEGSLVRNFVYDFNANENEILFRRITQRR